MKKNKNISTRSALIGAATLCATVCATPNLMASLTYLPGTSGTVDVNNNYSVNLMTVTATSGNSSSTFNTFCLDSQAFVNTPGTYNYVVSASPVPSSGYNFITVGTAWLYYNYANGSLAGYQNTAEMNTALQEAIWWLQGDAKMVGADLSANLFVMDVTAALGSANLRNNDNGAYGVVALTLTDPTGQLNPVQPILGITNAPSSVPEPGTIMAGALLLLPFGVSTIRILRRQKVQ